MKLTERGLDFINEASLERCHNPTFEALTGLRPLTLEDLCFAYQFGLIEVDCATAKVLMTIPYPGKRPRVIEDLEMN